MACTSSTLTRNLDVLKEQSGLRRSQSTKDLYRHACIHWHHSDNHLCYFIKPIHAALEQPKLENRRSLGCFPFQLSNSIVPNWGRSFLLYADTSKNINMEREMVGNSGDSGEGERNQDKKRGNWIERLMEICKWTNSQQKEVHECEDSDCECREGGGSVNYGTDEDGEITSYFFQRFLVKVPWSDTKQLSKLAFLSNLAYITPLIKAHDLKTFYGLRFVTSSFVKKAEAEEFKERLDHDATWVPKQNHAIHPSVAYGIAAEAASYVRSVNMEGSNVENLFRSGDQLQQREEGGCSLQNYKSEVAVPLTASTMRAIITAGERETHETAIDLRSAHSTACEWFICDDNSTYTRCFVIQGLESLKSWQRILLFEPTKFEGTNVLVHRGVYEEAKVMYEQFMPQIIDHLARHGERAKLQFTGHCLGGSVSLLIHLMLLTRNSVKPSTLQPVVTFGSPFVFFGGQEILDILGLDENQIHCVMMHRDIVPRAFSCNYPNHVATLLKRLNGSFESHPSLMKNKILYSPVGKLFILQPHENSSLCRPHPLLPAGSALYALDKTQHGYSSSILRTFLNSPHPLETLSNPAAYGSEGTIVRDHDSSNYPKTMNEVLRLHTRKVVRTARKQRNVLWPLFTSPSPHTWNPENNLESES